MSQISHSFWESWIQESLNWMTLPYSLSWSCSQAVSEGSNHLLKKCLSALVTIGGSFNSSPADLSIELLTWHGGWLPWEWIKSTIEATVIEVIYSHFCQSIAHTSIISPSIMWKGPHKEVDIRRQGSLGVISSSSYHNILEITSSFHGRHLGQLWKTDQNEIGMRKKG
jgi:hypothetical protein